MNERDARIAVFLSGGGSNFQALLDAHKAGILSGKVVLVLSNNKKAGGLEKARAAGVESMVYRSKDFESEEAASLFLLEKLREADVGYIALCGYLRLLPVEVVREFSGRILNVHPALLPKYGGRGMYGHFVHEAVIAAGEKESGVTVHMADEIYDHGKILEQVKVEVLPDDTPESLAARILKQEHKLYPRVLEKLIKGYYS
ncbi:MAG: phosphoribosylglycinamide formyltransferase [bacterium]|nr:phosphoribosylglycinamide formyltransferase [bacterium]